MMANLNSKALETLGDSRLRPNLEEKMLEEYKEWKNTNERTNTVTLRSSTRG